MISAALQTSIEKGADAKASILLDQKTIFSREYRCLTEHRHRLLIQDLEYLVEFIPDTFDKTCQYRKARDAFLKTQSVSVP